MRRPASGWRRGERATNVTDLSDFAMRAAHVFKKVARSVGLERRRVAPARMCCERYALATFGARRRRPGGRILAYHTVGQPEWGVNDVSPRQFRRQLELALRLGYRFVPASHIALTGGAPLELAVTFDDGARSVRTHAAPILRDYGIPYTVFLVTDWSDGRVDQHVGKVMTWPEVAELVAAGAEIGSHSVAHPDFAAIGPERREHELTESRHVIQARLGLAPETFAIPFGQSGNWPSGAAQAARKAGYAIVYAQAEETRPAETIARTFVTRFDGDYLFRALLRGAFDRWEEWF
jgi:peptidoglycan/xylan/chitin deacetylase (PgdA/CDA1 family)